MTTIIQFPHRIREDSEAHRALRAARDAESTGDLIRAIRHLSAAIEILAAELTADGPKPRQPEWVRRAIENDLPTWSRHPETVR